jgi:hypothetical protein
MTALLGTGQLGRDNVGKTVTTESQDRTSGIWQLGQDSRDKSKLTDQSWRGQPKQEREDRTARTWHQGQDSGTGQLGKDSWYKTAEKRQLVQDSWDKTAGRNRRTGQLERIVGIVQSRQERGDRTSRTGKQRNCLTCPLLHYPLLHSITTPTALRTGWRIVPTAWLPLCIYTRS